jgi:DNA-binding transcriptional LysR family regulator
MDKVDVGLLRLFLVLMSERSVSRTAERMAMSQPATSRALARLRLLFDDPLLLRSSRGMVPTARASELERSTRAVLEGFDRLTSPVAGFVPAHSRRTFVLTSPELGERVLMPTLLRRLRAEAPQVRIEVRAPDPSRAYELLESGEVDLRIAWLLKPMSTLRSMQLFQDEMVCIADRAHPVVHGRLTLQQFIDLPHARTLGTTQATTSRVIDEAVERLGKKLDRAFLVQNFLTIPSALAGTDILATLPLSQARIFAAQYPLQVLEPPLRLPRIRYAGYWHERSQNDEGHRWLRKILLEAARHPRV